MIKYALITPARNEEDFLEQTIQSVVAQTLKPQRWLIVNDRSTDSTGEIAQKYADAHDFIEVITVTGDNVRNFGSKAKAIDYAYKQLADVDFDYIGNLDADITHKPDYYENILTKMEANPRLGLAGGARFDKQKEGFRLIETARNSVGGPIQLFRRECFEQIEGYRTLPYGGIDAVAETTARMKGWEVESFPEYQVHHHRRTGTANRSVLNARFREGIRDYTIGYHIIFETARTLSRLNREPYVVASVVRLGGFIYAMLSRKQRAVPDDFIDYLQDEQIGRLRRLFKRK